MFKMCVWQELFATTTLTVLMKYRVLYQNLILMEQTTYAFNNNRVTISLNIVFSPIVHQLYLLLHIRFHLMLLIIIYRFFH